MAAGKNFRSRPVYPILSIPLPFYANILGNSGIFLKLELNQSGKCSSSKPGVISKKIPLHLNEKLALLDFPDRNKALTNYDRQKLNEAEEYVKEQLSHAKELRDEAKQLRANGNLGILSYIVGEFEKAIEYHNEELKIAQRLKKRDEERRANGNLGHAYHGLGNLREAIPFHQEELEIASQMGDKSAEGLANRNLGIIYLTLRDFDEARKHHENELKCVQGSMDRKAEGRAETSLGDVHFSRGDCGNAIDHYQKGLDIAEEVKDEIGKSRSIAYLSLSYHLRGGDDEKKADDLLQKTRQILKDKKLLVDVLCNFGDISLDRGEYRISIKHFDEARTIAEKENYLAGKGGAYGWLGKAYSSLGDYESALRWHREQLSIAVDIQDMVTQGRAHCNLGHDYRNIPGFFAKGLEHDREGLKIAKEQRDEYGEGLACSNLGAAFQSIGDFEEAKDYHYQHLMIAQKLEHRGQEGRAFRNLGTLYCCLRDFQLAEVYHRESLKIARAEEDKVNEGLSHCLLGRDFECAGRLPEALNHYRCSMEIYVSLRDEFLFQDQWKIAFREQQKPMYTALLRVLVKLGLTDEALFAAEHGRAQNLSDHLKKRFGCRVPRTLLEMARLVRNLPAQIVFFALGSSKIYFWVLKAGERIHFRQRKLDNAAYLSVQDLTQSAYFALMKAGQQQQQQQPQQLVLPDETPRVEILKTLYDLIVGPIEDLLTEEELIIIPDGPLHFVPFAALLNHNDKPEYLSSRYRIRIFPSLTSLNCITTYSEDQHSKVGALLVGNPSGSYLKHAQDEVKYIKNIIKKTGQENIITLIQEKATKEAVLQNIETVALIHIAAHGEGIHDGIQLAQTEDSSDSNTLSMADVQDLQLRARLVVLSCCATGRGKVTHEGVIGIARAFLCAGSRAVLASLWNINDTSAMQFMEYFYKHLVEERKKVTVAYQMAMKELRENASSNNSEKHWAPFVLIGDDVTLRFAAPK